MSREKLAPRRVVSPIVYEEQFAEPGSRLVDPNFGAITNTLNEGRTFRFGIEAGF